MEEAIPDIVSAVVFDNGSETLQAGFTGDNYPNATIPSVVGRVEDPVKKGQFEISIADAAYDLEADAAISIDLKYPFEHGIVDDWDDVEALWRHTFKQISVLPDEYPILLTEPPLNPKANREKMTEIMFEQFNTSAMYVANADVLALYAWNRRTGLVLSSGYGATYSVPVYDGRAIADAINRLDIAGADLDQYLLNLIKTRDDLEQILAATNCRLESIIGNVKKELCSVALDYRKQMAAAAVCQPKTFNIITIKEEQFTCPEALFKPSLIGLDDSTQGIHQMIHSSIQKCDVDIRDALYANIILTGGSTMFPNLPERLERELVRLAPADQIIRLHSPPDNYSAWIGGAMLASLSTFESQQRWISTRDYAESGAGVVHRKCII